MFVGIFGYSNGLAYSSQPNRNPFIFLQYPSNATFKHTHIQLYIIAPTTPGSPFDATLLLLLLPLVVHIWQCALTLHCFSFSFWFSAFPLPLDFALLCEFPASGTHGI